MAFPAFLVAPLFDLLLLSNVLWPLIAILAYSLALGDGLEFTRLYLLSTPHRWITLFLVFGDRARFAARKTAYLSLLFFFVILALSPLIHTPLLLALIVLDYFWNAWHFGSQHAGILRIYSRLAARVIDPWERLETYFIRFLAPLVFFRVAENALTGRISEGLVEYFVTVNAFLSILDIPILIMISLFGLRAFLARKSLAAGRLIYLLSMFSIYACLLITHRLGETGWFFVLAALNAAFHAIEYLAIVYWSTRATYERRLQEPFHALLPHLNEVMIIFICLFAVVGWTMTTYFQKTWLLATLAVSFLHYAYDGMIWKKKNPVNALG